LVEDSSTAEIARNLHHRVASLIRLARADLPYCFWMSTLSIAEWKSS
jgi:hypothetical protein